MSEKASQLPLALQEVVFSCARQEIATELERRSIAHKAELVLGDNMPHATGLLAIVGRSPMWRYPEDETDPFRENIGWRYLVGFEQSEESWTERVLAGVVEAEWSEPVRPMNPEYFCTEDMHFVMQSVHRLAQLRRVEIPLLDEALIGF